jgi:hypothetical protein
MAEVIQNSALRRQTNLPNESAEYLIKRDELRLAEIELMRQRERVAELRRRLPQGGVVQDYAFQEGPAHLDAGDAPIRSVRLSELFTTPSRSLVIYHFMFGKKQSKPCPMCTMFIDGWNGVVQHLAQNIDVAIVAAAERRRQHVQVRSRQRGSRRESGLDSLSLQPRPRRHRSPLLQCSPFNGRGYQRAWHRSAKPRLQHPRPDAAGAWRLDRGSELRHRSAPHALGATDAVTANQTGKGKGRVNREQAMMS